MIKKVYRRDYTGEFVLKLNIIENGQSREVREWIPNTIVNNQTSNCAVIIGNGPSRANFNLTFIKNHRGGHLGRRRLQSYGCNALYRDFTPDFLITIDDGMAKEIINSGYADNHVVISRADNVVKHPGKLHLAPYNHSMNSGALATYLACFDGHKQIYLFGFDNQPVQGINNNIYAGTKNYDPVSCDVLDAKWIHHMASVFNVYDDVEFLWVTSSANQDVPEKWKYYTNLRPISRRDFVLMADL